MIDNFRDILSSSLAIPVCKYYNARWLNESVQRNCTTRCEMPIYTYRCENCGVQFDRRQSFNDEPLSVCPECQKEALRKVYLPVGIVFKGSGFYATDNRPPSGRESRLSDEAAIADSEGVATKETKKKEKKDKKTTAKAKE